jgi:hypothetical protein
MAIASPFAGILLQGVATGWQDVMGIRGCKPLLQVHVSGAGDGLQARLILMQAVSAVTTPGTDILL